jgi:hypothetical protein
MTSEATVTALPGGREPGIVPDVVHRADLLTAYDEQLRCAAEAVGGTHTVRLGPLWLVAFPGGRGFVTYRDLDDAHCRDLDVLVPAVLAHFQLDPRIEQVEWKTRGHDRAAGLHEVLVAHGFVAREPESIMVGEARRLTGPVDLPEGVTLRRITTWSDARAMSVMTDDVFGVPTDEARAQALWQRASSGTDVELWIAEAGGNIVSAGRLELVPDSDFAGIWGGATRPPWRGRGLYRALTAARARSALRAGRTLIHSDSTEFSRPILERAGLIKVSTTTPYLWSR